MKKFLEDPDAYAAANPVAAAPAASGDAPKKEEKKAAHVKARFEGFSGVRLLCGQVVVEEEEEEEMDFDLFG